MPPETYTIIGDHLPKNRLKLHQLILSSRDIPYRVEHDQNTARLLVPDELAKQARIEIDAFYRENAPLPELPPAARRSDAFPVIWIVIIWISLHLAMGYWENRSSMIPLFDADASKILSGDVYRCVTALFFHKDLQHLAGNTAFMLILGIPVIQLYGAGAGTFLVLFSGIAGNLSSAAYHVSAHHAIGGSTAVFGCAGLLCAYQTIHHSRRKLPLNMTGWTPIGAGVALIALLGMGKGSDIAAHIFGALWGAGIGLAAAVLPDRLLGLKNFQRLIYLISALVVLTAFFCGYAERFSWLR